MSFSHDRRGQSVVVGTVILFGFLILALASYQAFAVPAQNSAAEFDHSQDVQSDMEDLRASLLDIRDARQRSFQRSVRIGIGFRYDSRLFAVNPPPPEGALTTQDRGPIDIENVNVTPAETDHFENTNPLFDQEHDTRLLTLRPGYNEYQNPPRTTFEHSLLYNRFEGANRTVTGQRTIDGENQKLSLIAYSGDINRQGLSTTLDPETVDGPTPDIPVEADTGDTFTVTLPTHSPAVWTDLIGNTTSDGEANARVVDTTSHNVTVEFTGTWDLQMTRVGYDGQSGAGTPFSNVTVRDADLNRTFDVRWLGEETAKTDGVDFTERENILEINQSKTGDSVSIDGSVLVDADAITDATVDISTTNSSVASPESSTTHTVGGNFSRSIETSQGTARLFAASGDGVDDITVDVFGDPGEADPQITGGEITDNSEDGPGGSGGARLSLSELSVSNAEIVDTFRIEFDNQDNDASDEFEDDSIEGLIEEAIHDPPPGRADFGDEYEITVEILDENDEGIDHIEVEAEADGINVMF